MPYALNAGTKIYWEERGRGDPLLLIMGLGATLDLWHRVTPMLSATYRTILLDNRGAGRSDAPPGPYSIPQMADDALAVLDAAGVTAARVFGASMGGMIAQELALQHPARVRSLILGCTAPGGKAAVPADREVAAALAARMTLPPGQAARVMVPFIYDASTPRERVEEDIAIRERTAISNDAFSAQYQAIRSWPGTIDRLGELAMAVLVIHGETDRLVPPENGRVIAQAIPHAELVMIPNASHIFFTDQPDASKDALLPFLGR
ncbi:MAG TPA: alpha/beta fold hydrolase [Vicinamibacterales bacterium]|jgi:3-oxoadipate enol-lactonase|nr:alpha/beta fold hydrolase [Vicinamibacterales bacterium]